MPGKKHFVHADGTPLFYLGDTHWGLPDEQDWALELVPFGQIGK